MNGGRQSDVFLANDPAFKGLTLFNQRRHQGDYNFYKPPYFSNRRAKKSIFKGFLY